MKTFGDLKKGEVIYAIDTETGIVTDLIVDSHIDNEGARISFCLMNSSNQRKSHYAFNKHDTIASSYMSDTIWTSDPTVVKFGQLMFKNGKIDKMREINKALYKILNCHE